MNAQLESRDWPASAFPSLAHDGMHAEDGACLLAKLHEFPAPLAVIDQHGTTIMVSRALARRYGTGSVGGASLKRLLRGDGGDFRVSLLSSDQRSVFEVRALAVPVGSCHLLLVGDGASAPTEDEIVRLRAHVHQLEHVAATDHLTGAWNRAQFDRLLEAELARSAANRSPLSLVLLDIDHFKSINDRHGHAAGDAVLREFAALVQSKVRRSDLVFRWGGEEFALLLPDSGYRSAERVAEKVRQAVAAHSFTTAGPVRLSAGVAERLADETTLDWFERLDRALYEAKRSGRNRVTVDRRGQADDDGRLQVLPALTLEWREEYECGEPTIDAEHREMFDLANELLREAAGDGLDLVPKLEALIAHVQRHFTDEEAILEALGYPDLEQHKRHHMRLLARAGRLHHRAVSGEVRFGEIVEYLAQEVVASHLLTADRAFIPFLR